MASTTFDETKSGMVRVSVDVAERNSNASEKKGLKETFDDLEERLRFVEKSMIECTFTGAEGMEVSSLKRALSHLRLVGEDYNPAGTLSMKDVSPEIMRWGWLSERVNAAFEYSKFYNESLATDKIVRDGGELFARYTSPMNMSNSVKPSLLAEKVPNRMRLQAKISAMNRFKELSEKDPLGKYGDKFDKFLNCTDNSWYDQMLRTTETEIYNLGDWELIGTFKKITGRLPRTPRMSKKSSAIVEKVEAKHETPRKGGWLGRIAGKAAAFAAGVAIGAAGMFGYQNYSAPEKNVSAEAYASVERAEVKSNYSLDFDRFMDERMPKRTYNSLSLEDVANSNERDYSGFELNLR